MGRTESSAVGSGLGRVSTKDRRKTKVVSSLADTYHMRRTSDGSPACFFFSRQRDLGRALPIVAAGEVAVPAPETVTARRPASLSAVST